MSSSNGNITFEIFHNGKRIPVVKIIQKTAILYGIKAEEKQIFLTKATAQSGKPFWTSIPQGYQEIASQIGPLIEEYEKKGPSIF